MSTDNSKTESGELKSSPDTHHHGPGLGHILMIIITSLAAGLLFAVLYEMFVDKDDFQNFWYTYVVATAIFAPIDYLLFSYKYKCKKCGAKWARDETHTEDIDRYTKTKQETYTSNGVQRTRDVQYRIREYWQYFVCKECGDVTREREKSEERL